MNRKLFFGLILCCITLSSCEGWRHARGYILDNETRQPIVGATIQVLSDRNLNTSVSDSLGRFYVHNPMGGCMPKCSDIAIRVGKDQYEYCEFINPGDSIHILLKRK